MSKRETSRQKEQIEKSIQKGSYQYKRIAESDCLQGGSSKKVKFDKWLYITPSTV